MYVLYRLSSCFFSSFTYQHLYIHHHHDDRLYVLVRLKSSSWFDRVPSPCSIGSLCFLPGSSSDMNIGVLAGIQRPIVRHRQRLFERVLRLAEGGEAALVELGVSHRRRSGSTLTIAPSCSPALRTGSFMCASTPRSCSRGCNRLGHERGVSGAQPGVLQTGGIGIYSCTNTDTYHVCLACRRSAEDKELRQCPCLARGELPADANIGIGDVAAAP
ncbi:unnamed protein product, partial [Ectocarpus sp. 12 AP-2014]